MQLSPDLIRVKLRLFLSNMKTYLQTCLSLVQIFSSTDRSHRSQSVLLLKVDLTHLTVLFVVPTSVCNATICLTQFTLYSLKCLLKFTCHYLLTYLRS
jgi:hypothetical protein